MATKNAVYLTKQTLAVLSSPKPAAITPGRLEELANQNGWLVIFNQNGCVTFGEGPRRIVYRREGDYYLHVKDYQNPLRTDEANAVKKFVH